MYRYNGLFVVILIAVWILCSCNRLQNELDTLRLQRWDMLCDSLPEAIRDSLNTMETQKLSPGNLAWHGLLKTITSDKTFSPFTSDSLINSVEYYYRENELKSRNHIRSLIYQGVVRVRMGVTDSTVYEPLKKALAFLYTQKNPDHSLLYFANYYMGHVHGESKNYETAFHYYQQALKYAKKKANDSYLFSIYLKLFWLRLSEKEYDDAKNYLDILATYARTFDDNYYLLNAQSVYFNIQGEYQKGLQKEKEQLILTHKLKKKPQYFKLYYSLSDRYFNINYLDSALYYARQSIAHIEDSTYRLNYLLYENAAEIAAEMNDYRLADDFRRQALKSYGISVEERLDTQIQELEKKYDLAESENSLLKVKNRFFFILALSAFGVLFTITMFLYFSRQHAIARLQQSKLTMARIRAETEKEQADAKSKLLHDQSENQRQLLLRYDVFLRHHAEQQQQMLKMADKIRSKHPSLGDTFDKMMEVWQQQFQLLVKEFFTDEDMQRLFNIHDDKGILTESERLLLYMLANECNNMQIAAMLNITTNNLKSKKSYLKKKIALQTNSTNGFQNLSKLF